MPNLSYNKYGRSFGNIGHTALTPLRNCTRYDKLLGRGDITRNRQLALRRAYLKHLLHKFHVAVGRLDEYLRLMLYVGSALQRLNSLATLGRLYGQIAVKCK